MKFCFIRKIICTKKGAETDNRRLIKFLIQLKNFLAIQRNMPAGGHKPDIFQVLTGFQRGSRSLRIPK